MGSCHTKGNDTMGSINVTIINKSGGGGGEYPSFIQAF